MRWQREPMAALRRHDGVDRSDAMPRRQVVQRFLLVLRMVNGFEESSSEGRSNPVAACLAACLSSQPRRQSSCRNADGVRFGGSDSSTSTHPFGLNGLHGARAGRRLLACCKSSRGRISVQYSVWSTQYVLTSGPKPSSRFND